MKKTFAMVLAILMLMTALTACAPNNAKTTDKKESQTSAEKVTDKANEAEQKPSQKESEENATKAAKDETEATTAEATTAEAAKEAATTEEAAKAEGQMTEVDSLSLYFVPSREPDEIVAMTEPLKELLKSEMTKQGYQIGKVDIFVGTTYEAVGEALSAGTADVALGMPGGTYVLYDDGAKVILTATRNGLSKDFDQAKDWNDGKATETSDKQAVSYRYLMIAGPSEKGQAIAEKVNKGEKLTWDDINGLKWSIMNPSSSAGYIYPALYFQDLFQKGIGDLSNAVQSDSYGSAFARLASGQVDALMCYADARRDNAEKWTGEFKREKSIWEETNVIGVTVPIYNDTIAVSKNSKKIDDKMIDALQKAFIAIGESEKGKEVIAVYSHNGYQIAKDSDYDKERDAQKLIQSLGSK